MAPAACADDDDDHAAHHEPAPTLLLVFASAAMGGKPFDGEEARVDSKLLCRSVASDGACTAFDVSTLHELAVLADVEARIAGCQEEEDSSQSWGASRRRAATRTTCASRALPACLPPLLPPGWPAWHCTVCLAGTD